MTTATNRSPTRRARAAPASRMAFLREYLRAPGDLGTCFVSSKRMSRAMVEGLDLERARAVVELGPGTGAITRAVLERIPAGCSFVAIERNDRMAELFRGKFPRVRLYADDAANIGTICAREGIGGVDAVVSGLPWLIFPEALQARILRETVGLMRPGARLNAITYNAGRLMPKVRRFRRLMESMFSEVGVRGPIWGNLPPAFVYSCRA